MSAPLPPGVNAPPVPGPPPTAPALVPLADVMIRALPDKLAGLDRAVVISGQVVAQGDGKATIRTAAGDVSVETPAPLPTDRPITLRIPSQVPGTPPRAAALAPPQVQTPAPSVATPAPGPAAATSAATPPPPPLPQIQPGATIAAIVVAAAQPRPPSPPPPASTANAAAGNDPVDLPPPAGAKAPAAPAAPPPAPTSPAAPPPAATGPQPASPPLPGGSLPPLASLLGGGTTSPVMATAPGPGPTPPLPPDVAPPPNTGANDAPEGPPTNAPAASPPVRTDAMADRDAARLARLARYNIPATPSAGLFAFSDLEGRPPIPPPGMEARLRGTAPPAPPTAPATTPIAAPAPPPSGPAPAGPADTPAGGPARPPTPAPALPAGTPAAAGMPVDLARLRGDMPSPSPTAPPTAPAPGGTQPDAPRPLPGTPPQPAMQEARVRDGTPAPATAPPTIPVAPGQPAQPGSSGRPAAPGPQAAPSPDGSQTARLRDGAPPPPPTAPPTVPVKADSSPPTPAPPPPQGTSPAAGSQTARLRDGAPPPSPTAPPTIQGEPVPLPPARPGTGPVPGPGQAPPVQEARARDTAPPSPPTAPPTTPVGTAPPPPRPALSPADVPGQQARIRDGLAPPAPTAPPTVPEGQQGPSPTRPPQPAPAPPPASPARPAEPPPSSARPLHTPSPEPEIQVARARGEAPAATTAPPTVPTAPPRPVPLPNGQPVQLRVLAVESGPAPAAATTGLASLTDNRADAPANSITGTLVGNTAQGQPVVTTPQGTLVLRARTDLPPGTNLTLALEIPQNRDLASLLPPLDPAQGTDWPVMRELMASLVAADPAMARTLAAAILPQPNRRLTTNLTFFLSALRGGDAAGWLGGDAAELLKARGGAQLLARLRDDFQAAARQAAEPTPDGWRAMPIPFGTPEQVMRAQLHVRSATEQDGDDARGDGRGPPKRFLLDLDFSRIGPMQLDGMVWPGRFDLMIRTQTLLPADLRQSIGTIFRDSLETVGYAGTIGFQTGAHFWARVQSARRGSGVKA